MSQSKTTKPGQCESQPCRVCYPDALAAGKARDRMQERTSCRYTIVYCGACGMWHTEPAKQ